MHTQYPEENGLELSQRDPQLVQNCFKQGGLKQLVEKAHFLLKVDHELQKILPPEYRAHCQLMNIEGTSLSLGVSNAALATRIRYQSREILASLKEALPELRGVTVVNVKIRHG